MKVIEVTRDDGLKMAHLISLLKSTNKLIDSLKMGGIDITGDSIAYKDITLLWVNDLAKQMAVALQPPKAPAAKAPTISTKPPVKVPATPKAKAKPSKPSKKK